MSDDLHHLCPGGHETVGQTFSAGQEWYCATCDTTGPYDDVQTVPPPTPGDADDVRHRPACPHCGPTHTDPTSGSWGVYIAAVRDGDGQPIRLNVERSNGAHVAQSDADWLWALIREAPSEIEQLRAELRHLRTKQAVQIEELTRHRANVAKSGCLGCMEREQLRDWWAATSQTNAVKYERAKQRWYEAEDKAALAAQEGEAWRERAEQAEATIARVHALHRVHRCEDGHMRDSTPNPCFNNRVCSCGHRDPCPTLAAIDGTREEETHVEP